MLTDEAITTDTDHGLLGLGADEVVLALTLRRHGDHTDVHLDIHGNIDPEKGEQARDWTFTPAAAHAAMELAKQLVSLVLADNVVYGLMQQLAREGVEFSPGIGGGMVVTGLGDELEADDNVFQGVTMVRTDEVHEAHADEASSCATDGEYGGF